MKSISRLRLRLPFLLRKNGTFRQILTVSSSERHVISTIDSPVRGL